MGYSGGGREGYFSSLHHTRPTPKTTKKREKNMSKYEQLAMGDPGADTYGGIIVVGSVGREGYFLSTLDHPPNYKKKRIVQSKGPWSAEVHKRSGCFYCCGIHTGLVMTCRTACSTNICGTCNEKV
jgi:hypothetical protein